jgi:hypothetical protein
MSTKTKPHYTTGDGLPPQPGITAYEVKKLLENEFRELARCSIRETASQHDLWCYLIGRHIELQARVEKLEATSKETRRKRKHA